MSSSLLLSLSSKTSLPKLALRCHTLRMFSSSSSTNPYLMYCVTYCGEAPEAGAMTELRMFDPAKEEYFTVPDKPLPEELVDSKLVGSSHGWGVFLGDPSSVLISDYCNPSSSKSNPKMISLPPRRYAHYCQHDLVSGVAMSSFPEEEDFVGAVKFAGRRVSIYTPGQHCKGNRLCSSIKLYDYFEQANLMYSKSDQRFYMPSSGGHHLWSWNGKISTQPQYHELRFHNLPQISLSELQLLRSYYRTQQLASLPQDNVSLSNGRYIEALDRYVQNLVDKSVEFNFGGTKLFMVFREEEDMNMCYTEDIGDLCIFLGNNEPFCVKASSFPGLKSNSIYFSGDSYGQGYGVYDIATRTPRSFHPKSFSAFSDLPNGEGFVITSWVPHWIPPSSL